jgi:hypothetical protein
MGKKEISWSDIIITIIVDVILVGSLFLITKPSNKTDLKIQEKSYDDGGICTAFKPYPPEFKLKALCPFNCIDSGFEGGHYSNLLNKCVCKVKINKIK